MPQLCISPCLLDETSIYHAVATFYENARVQTLSCIKMSKFYKAKAHLEAELSDSAFLSLKSICREKQMKRVGSGKIAGSVNSGSGSAAGHVSEARPHNSNVSSSAVSGARKGGQKSSQFQNLGSGLPQNIPRHQQV